MFVQGICSGRFRGLGRLRGVYKCFWACGVCVFWGEPGLWDFQVGAREFFFFVFWSGLCAQGLGVSAVIG